MQSIRIRSATLDDLPILYEFEQGIISAERPFDPTLKVGRINYYDLREKIESATCEVIVATINMELVGSAYVEIKPAKSYQKFNNYAYVGFMFVEPEHRGKGISRAIIEELQSWAKNRGLEEIRLEVYDDNHSAVRAYEKAGFKKNLVEMRMELKS